MAINNFRILLLLLFFICSIQTGITKELPIELDQKIEAIFNKLDMTGLGIAVVKNDSIIFQKSYGYRVLPQPEQKGELLDNEDIYRIASISKTFIATAILQLIEKGKINLNDNAERYLNFPLRNPNSPEDTITVKMLLTHTSSINDSRSWWNINHIIPQNDNLYYQCYSPEKPGEKYKYCNMNYTVLGAVIEGATGERFYKYIDINILNPLDIKGSFNCNELDSTLFVRQYRYKEDLGHYVEDDETYRPYTKFLGDKYVLQRSLGLAYPASGMKISTGDLARYMMMHMNYGDLNGAHIISKDSELLMQQNYVGNSNYGLSYRQYRDIAKGKVFHGQTGGGNGLRGAMIFDPVEKIGFVILCSGSKSKYIDGYGDIHKPLIQLLYNYFMIDE